MAVNQWLRELKRSTNVSPTLQVVGGDGREDNRLVCTMPVLSLTTDVMVGPWTSPQWSELSALRATRGTDFLHQLDSGTIPSWHL
jgi:hypothetical protein